MRQSDAFPCSSFKITTTGCLLFGHPPDHPRKGDLIVKGSGMGWNGLAMNGFK